MWVSRSSGSYRYKESTHSWEYIAGPEFLQAPKGEGTSENVGGWGTLEAPDLSRNLPAAIAQPSFMCGFV